MAETGRERPTQERARPSRTAAPAAHAAEPATEAPGGEPGDLLLRPDQAAAAGGDDAPVRSSGAGRPSGAVSRPIPTLRLQRTIGNAAVGRALQRARAGGAPVLAPPVARPEAEEHDGTAAHSPGPETEFHEGAAPEAEDPAAPGPEPAGAAAPAETPAADGPALEAPAIEAPTLAAPTLEDVAPAGELAAELHAASDPAGLAAGAELPGGAGAGTAGGAPIQRFAELHAPLMPLQAPAVPTPELAAPAPSSDVSGAVEGGASQVSAAGSAPSGGGLVESVLARARSWVTSRVGNAAGAMRRAGGAIASAFGGPLLAAFNAGRAVGQRIAPTVVSTVRSVWGRVSGPLRAMQRGVGSVVRRVVHGASAVIRPLTSRIGPLVRRLLNTGGDIVGAVAGLIGGAITRLGRLLGGLPGRIAAAIGRAVSAIGHAMQALVARVAGLLNRALARITSTITRVLRTTVAAVQRVVGFVGRLVRAIPTVIRTVVLPIVTAVLAATRRVVAAVVRALTATLRAAARGARRVITGFVRAVGRGIRVVTRAALAAARGFANLVRRGVTRAVGGVRAMARGVRDAIAGILHRILDPLRLLVATRLAEWIAPRIKAAIRQAGGMQKMLASIPRRVAGASREIAGKVADAAVITGHDVLRGLMRPDGDHFSFGISVGVTGEEGVGAGVAITGNADLVVDYPSHEIGIFFTPGVTVGAGGGLQAEAGPDVDLTGAWGTVLSFGANRGAGVRQGYQGAFMGAGMNVDAELGARVTRSEGIYVGAAPLWDATQPVRDAAQQGWSGGGSGTPPPAPPPPPPAPVPAPLPTPAAEVLLTSQQVRFDTGKATISPAGRAVIANVLDSAGHAHTLHADARYRIASVGGASLRWRHPGRGDPDALNQALSVQRAQVVAAEVRAGLGARGLGGITEVQQDAMGATLGHVLNLPADDNSPALRATTLTAYEQPAAPPPAPAPAPAPGPAGSGGGAGGPGAPAPVPGPGGPGSGPNSPSVGPHEWNWFGDDRPGKGIGSAIPNPLHGPLVPDLLHRPTMGWDSGISLGLRPGVGVGGNVTGNAVFSIPIGAYGFPPAVETPLRISVGLIKLGLDIMTMNIQGGLRDGVGIVGALVPPAIVNGIANFVFPLPPGYTD